MQISVGAEFVRNGIRSK